MPINRTLATAAAIVAIAATKSVAFAQTPNIVPVTLPAASTAPAPAVVRVVILGAERTRHSVILDRLDLDRFEVVSAASLKRAARRASDMPAFSRARLGFLPGRPDAGAVAVDVKERPLFPAGWKDWAAIGGRALILDVAEVEIASPMGRAERIDLEYGWKRERPRWAVRAIGPAPGPLPGLGAVEVSWRQHAFAIPVSAGTEMVRHEQMGVRLGLEDWATAHLHWRVRGGVDRFDRRPHASFTGALGTRWLDDRLALEFETTLWAGARGVPGFWLSDVGVKWRQRVSEIPSGWSAEAGTVAVSGGAPLILWPGGDAGWSREATLRAHRLYTRGVVTGVVFGQRLASASATYERPVYTMKYGTVNLAGFVDTAHAWRGLEGRPPRAQVDIGIGAHVYTPKFGNVRLDFGYGLRDHGFVVSAGFIRPWPGR